MPFVDAAKNTMLDSLTIDLLSLHDDHPGSDGLSNELTGGSPAYARETAVVDAATGGTRALNADVEFDVPASTVAVIGFWEDDTTDVFHGWAPNGAASNNPQAAYGEASGNTVNLDGHGLSDDDRVFLTPLADALPGGLGATTLYHVISSTAATFQVALTQGGAAVDITTDGDLIFQKCIPEVYGQQGTHTVKAGVSAGL
jgi:hypothetical protein